MPPFEMPALGPRAAYAAVLLAAATNMVDVAADSAVVNNLPILPGYLEYYNIDANLLGLNAAITSAGYVVGGPFSGYLMDRIGRIRSMSLGLVLTIIAVAISGSAPIEAPFIIGRFILGFSFSISSTAATLYLAEAVPAKSRQTVVGLVLATCGLITSIFTLVVLSLYQKGTLWAWRGFYLSELIAPTIGIIVTQFAPESPRWLISQGRTEEGLKILALLHANGDEQNERVQLEFREISATIEAEKSVQFGWKSLISPAPNLRRFAISVLTAIFFQMLGSGSIYYFLSTVLSNLGITSVKDRTLITWGIGLWSTLAMLLGGWIIDRVGRRPMLLYSTIGMALADLILGLLQRQLEIRVSVGVSAGAIFVIFIYSFISCVGWQILVYSYPNEILSYNQRAKGSALTQSISYAFSFIYLYCLPIALERITWKWWILNACWSAAFAVVIWFMFVETKGKTLEEITCIFEPDMSVIEGVNNGSKSSQQDITAVVVDVQKATKS